MLRWPCVVIAVAALHVVGADETDRPGDSGPGYQPHPDAPAFRLRPRQYDPDDRFKGRGRFFPCSKCHEDQDTDPEPRELTKHRRKLRHGGERIWCLVCHHSEDRDFLRTPSNGKVGFDQAYIVCGSCHADREKDWYFGAHGKNVSGSQDERVLLNCTFCHNPHAPAIKPRKPKPPPPVRVGMERQERHAPSMTPVWER